MIEVPPDEYTEYACNVLLLEPGKVIIPAAAKQTIKALRKEGIELLKLIFLRWLRVWEALIV